MAVTLSIPEVTVTIGGVPYSVAEVSITYGFRQFPRARLRLHRESSGGVLYGFESLLANLQALGQELMGKQEAVLTLRTEDSTHTFRGTPLLPGFSAGHKQAPGYDVTIVHSSYEINGLNMGIYTFDSSFYDSEQSGLKNVSRLKGWSELRKTKAMISYVVDGLFESFEPDKIEDGNTKALRTLIHAKNQELRPLLSGLIENMDCGDYEWAPRLHAVDTNHVLAAVYNQLTAPGNSFRQNLEYLCSAFGLLWYSNPDSSAPLKATHLITLAEGGEQTALPAGPVNFRVQMAPGLTASGRYPSNVLVKGKMERNYWDSLQLPGPSPITGAYPEELSKGATVYESHMPIWMPRTGGTQMRFKPGKAPLNPDNIPQSFVVRRETYARSVEITSGILQEWAHKTYIEQALLPIARTADMPLMLDIRAGNRYVFSSKGSTLGGVAASVTHTISTSGKTAGTKVDLRL
jgi:hypothetical protein